MQKIFEKILRLKDDYQSNIVFDTRLINKNDIFIGIGTVSKNGSIYYYITKAKSLQSLDL